MSTLILTFLLAANLQTGNIITNVPVVNDKLSTQATTSTEANPLEKTLNNIAASAKQTTQTSSNSMMIIEAKNRSDDFIAAFTALKNDVSASKITFYTKDNQSISNIIDITSIGSGTLLLFKTSSNRGVQYQVLAIENISKISVN